MTSTELVPLDAVPVEPPISADEMLSILRELEGAGVATPISLELDPDVSFERYEAIGAYLGKLRDLTSWWLGDWLLFGDGKFGDRMAQAVEATGRAKATLEDYARVSTYVPKSIRRPALSFHHHRLVARRTFNQEDQVSWLDRALESGWSVEEMRGSISAIDGNGGQGSLGGDGSEPAFRDERRLVEIAMRIARNASDLGDGRFAIDAEIVAQLRAAAGLGE